MMENTIAPSEISSELNRIWDALEGKNKMRASLFNLIFYTKTNLRESYIRTISQRVIEQFPARIIFITESDRPSENFLLTRVSVMTSKAEQNDVACDAIDIDVAGTHVERVPFVILPHILPDLPIYVIWAEDPCPHSVLLKQLEKLASRIIFDSESIENLTEFAQKLLSYDMEKDFDIADLNWARTESWRELLASAFYTEERLQMLHKTQQIQICYNAHKSEAFCHTPIQSLYLQGWLATQLGWALKEVKQERGKWAFTYLYEKKEITITLFPEDLANFKPGTIVSVDLQTQDQDHFSFGCNLDAPHLVSMRFSTLEKCDMPLKYIFAKEESGRSLVKEICHRGTSTHFFHLLNHFAKEKELKLREF